MFFLFNFMSSALQEAKKCINSTDVPVGCVIVKEGTIIGTGFNTRGRDKNPLGHAELNAILAASEYLNDWRLTGCDMYVTLEPCAMCAGAILASRIRNLYFGAYDTKEGSAGSRTNMLYPDVNVYGGILADDCVSLLNDFFRSLRN